MPHKSKHKYVVYILIVPPVISYFSKTETGSSTGKKVCFQKSRFTKCKLSQPQQPPLVRWHICRLYLVKNVYTNTPLMHDFNHGSVTVFCEIQFFSFFFLFLMIWIFEIVCVPWQKVSTYLSVLVSCRFLFACYGSLWSLTRASDTHKIFRSTKHMEKHMI